MPIYPEQTKQLQQTMQGSSLPNQQYGQQLMSFGLTPEIKNYEKMVQYLPRLPLNAKERAAVVGIVQAVLARMPDGSTF